MDLVASVQSVGGSVDLLGQIKTYLINSKIKLFKMALVPSPITPVADFNTNEADFAGYAAVTVAAFSAVAIDADERAVIVSPRAFFQATDGVTPNSIGGAWLETAAGVLIEYVTFPQPLQMSAALAYIAATWFFRQPGAGNVMVEN